jgi:hypothetical protein
MKGPLDAIRRRRTDSPAHEADATQAATEAPTTAQPAAGLGPATPADGASQPPPGEAAPSGGVTRLWGSGASDAAPVAPAAVPPAEATPPVTDSQGPPTIVPAGEEPAPSRVSFRQRGRLRRRLRYLRRVRELGFRDLGGLVFDQHRFSSINEELVRGKLAALASIDTELRALELALNDRRPITELREPGISVCPRCGGLHGSEARYCPSCGVAFQGPLAIAEVGDAVRLPGGEIAHMTPAPTEPEPTPAATEVAEREAAKAQAESQSITAQPTEVMDAVPNAGERAEP